MIIGAAMEPTQGVSISLVYKLSDQSGAAAPATKRVTSIGLMSQLKF